MNKNMLIGIAVVAVLIIGGYFVYTSMNSSGDAQAAAAAGADAQQAAPTDQVQAQEVSVGTGAEAVPGATVSVLYVGQLQDGTVFDSSAAHGNEPLTFVLGADGMIPGFQIGVNGMREGGERLMAIPAALGYGAQEVKDANGKVIIPANSTIVFDVKLVKVVPPAK
jgi:FKBP-type peptidyl-prolyl cis-trans isomerase FkpA